MYAPGHGNPYPLNNDGIAIFRDTDEATPKKVPWTFLARLLLTIFLRIGFILVQIGSVPVTNINLILLQNILDFSWITIVYLIGGFVIAYNGDISGVIGQGQWIGDENAIEKEEILVGWQAAIVASAICTCCLVGRTHTVGYLFIGLIISGLVQPFAIHWAWTANGWMAHNKFIGSDVAFRDFGGTLVVHAVGGLTGFIGCTILGRRIIRLHDIDSASIPADSAGSSLAGYFFILLGLQSLCFPSAAANHPRTSDKEISMIIVNNLLGASSCSLVVVALHFVFGKEPFNHWTVMRCIQASIAGTTLISAGVNYYNPVLCLGLGFTGGVIHYLVSRQIFQSALEDYCNVVATHLVCSIVGSLMAPFGSATLETIKNPAAMLVQAAWQVICLVAIVALVTVPITLAFAVLECLGLLRNRSEIVNHFRAVVAAHRAPSRSYMQRLFVSEGNSLYLQPGAGHIRGRRESRVPNHQRPTMNFETPQKFVQSPQKLVNTEVFLSTSSPSVAVRATRVKKLRQVHTLRSTSEIAIFESEEHKKSMGDDRKSHEDEKKVSIEDEKKIEINGKRLMIECSGDSSNERLKINGDSLIKTFTVFPPLEMKMSDLTRKVKILDKNLKKEREPYRLHRTQKCTNLLLEAISENDPSVEFLVSPSARNFSSTESDSENEALHASLKNHQKNSRKSFPPVATRKTLEFMDIRL